MDDFIELQEGTADRYKRRFDRSNNTGTSSRSLKFTGLARTLSSWLGGVRGVFNFEAKKCKEGGGRLAVYKLQSRISCYSATVKDDMPPSSSSSTSPPFKLHRTRLSSDSYDAILHPCGVKFRPCSPYAHL